MNDRPHKESFHFGTFSLLRAVENLLFSPKLTLQENAPRSCVHVAAAMVARRRKRMVVSIRGVFSWPNAVTAADHRMLRRLNGKDVVAALFVTVEIQGE